MLRISNLTKSYGGTPIFERINLTLHRGEHVGLIGPNGAGKSTLLKLIAGLESPDSGSVWRDPSSRLGYLAQALVYTPTTTVLAVMQEAIGPALRGLARLEELGQEIARAEGDRYEAVMTEYALTLEEAERLDAYGAEARLAQTLAGLGLAHLTPDTLVATLSGGQKTRLGLARLLMTRPDLLLLDEPTNHLDLEALDWMQDFVRHYEGTVVIVSHDRAFLDRTVGKLLVIVEETHSIEEFVGTYTEYVAEIERRRAKQFDDYRGQQQHIAEVEENIRVMKQRSANQEHSTIDFWLLKKAARGARTAKVRERKLERMLNSEEKIEKPGQTWQMKLDFGDSPPSGQLVLSLEGVGKRFGERELFHDLSLEVRQGERIALLGANGTGKTTLLRLISGQVEADSGTVRLGAKVRPGYFSQEQEGLNSTDRVLDTVRAVAPISEMDARTFLHYFLFSGDEAFRRVAQLSYGERARLVLARLVLSRVNFLLLDEPLNHLDITSRHQFEEALTNFDGTVVTVVHDRYFVEQFAERVWFLAGDGTLRDDRLVVDEG